MKVSVQTTNCTPTSPFIFHFSGDSSIEITVEIETLVSLQSRKTNRDNLLSLLNTELSKITWIITGKVTIDLLWYLAAVDRQEMYSSIDLDNLTKPILDGLTGAHGILIDDSQLMALYTKWNSKNTDIAYHILKIKVDFYNESVLDKQNLWFVQYYQGMCCAINFETNKFEDLLGARILIHQRRRIRKLNSKVKKSGISGGEIIVLSEYEFHKTRLSKFQNKVIDVKKLNSFCITAGLNLTYFRNFFKGHENHRPIMK